MRDRDQRAEAGAKRPDDLIGERDLGHQHQHLPARFQSRRRELQVNLGLAAGGDAPQQKSFLARIDDGGHDGLDHGRLLWHQIEIAAVNRIGPLRAAEYSSRPRC